MSVYSKERIEYSKTFQGKYFNFLGYFFSIYCVWKIFMVRTDFSHYFKSGIIEYCKNESQSVT